MKQLTAILPKVLKKNLNIISINLSIANNLNTIISPKIQHLIKFNKAIFDANGNLVIIFQVLSGATILINTEGQNIIDNIQLITGIQEIKTIYQQTQTLK